jgi:predicted PurR-regulated permease PerM
MDAKRLTRCAVILGVFFAFLAVSLLLWKILLPFLFAYILFFALKPLVDMLEQHGIPHLYSVLIIFIGSFGGLALLLILFVPALTSEFAGIQNNLGDYTRSVNLFMDLVREFISRYSSGFSFISPDGGYADSLVLSLKTSLVAALKGIPSILSTLLLCCMVIPFATFFLLLDEQRITKKMISLVPNHYFEITLNLLYNLNRQFGLILRGMFISVVIISILSTLGLILIKLHYPIIVGLFAGISNLIPYAGPIVGIAIAFVAALLTGAPHEIYLSIILVFAVVQLLDNVLVQPIVMAKSADLHPLLVLFLVIFGSTFGGVIGMFAIVPLVSLSQIVVKILYIEFRRPPRPDFSLYRDIDTPSSRS